MEQLPLRKSFGAQSENLQPGSAPNEDAGSQPDVRYVLSGQSTGWSAMAEKVRAYDEDKVKDTKEDIDTLLVFAGLFSAVLTAFLVESYQKLLPDTASQMLAVSTQNLAVSSQTLIVMQQISLQLASPDSNVSATILNSTFFPPDNMSDPALQPGPFQPSAADIRVNVLWFASLIFSLVTASFGMLVKQWLREYLAVENPSPQARLRIRHFREPELQQWKVLEIAAVLPLLQQLSLALFFIGLCYFTESVHNSVGHTSLPLVAGWAFCFTTVTILPFFFPRCPYKTTLLMTLHIRLARSVKKIADRMYFGHEGRLGSLGGSIGDRLHTHIAKNDETIVVATERQDMDILVDVDALQSNDELLGSTIAESLQQIHEPAWAGVVVFLLRVLEHRLQRVDLVSSSPAPLELWRLSRAGYNAIVDILACYARGEYAKYQDLLAWLEDDATLRALYILFSPTPYSLPDSGITVLKDIFQLHGADLIRILVRGCSNTKEPSWSFYVLINSVSRRLEDMNVDLASSVGYFETFMDARFDAARGDSPPGGFTITTEDLRAWPWSKVTDKFDRRQIAEFFIAIVRRALRHMRQKPVGHDADGTVASSPRTTTGNRDELTDALVAMCKIADISNISWSNTLEAKFSGALAECFAEKESMFALLNALARVPASAVAHVYAGWRTYRFKLEVGEQSLENFIDGVDELCSAVSQAAADSDLESGALVQSVSLSHALSILCVAIHLVKLPSALKYADRWKALFRSLLHLVHQSLDIPPPSNEDTITSPSLSPIQDSIQSWGVTSADAKVVHICLREIQWHDSSGKVVSAAEVENAYQEWMRVFRDEDTVFEDGLVEMLGAMYYASREVYASADVDGYYRVRRLGVKSRLDAGG